MPEHKGLISAIIFAIGGLSSPIFNLIGEAIINPDNKILLPEEKYYDYSLMHNLFAYYYIGIKGIILSTVFSLCFVFQFRQEDYHTETLPLPEAKTEEKGERKQKQSQNDLRYYSDLKQILCTFRVWNIFLISFCGNFLPFIISISFKAIGTYARFSVLMLKSATSLMGIVKNGISPLWGHLFDKLGYGPLIKLINIGSVIFGIAMCLSIHNETLFCFLGVLNTVFIAGFRSVLDPLVMKIYSIDYMMELGGIIGLSLASTSMIGTAISLTASTLFVDKDIAYYLIFLLGSALSAVSFLLSFVEKEKPFIFNGVKKDSNANEMDDEEEQVKLLS